MKRHSANERAETRMLLNVVSAGWLLIVLAACSPHEHEAGVAEPTPSPASGTAVAAGVPAGAYTLEKSHASLIFRVDHLGFSNYTARFKRFDAQLQFDPADPAASTLTATVDPGSIETDFPDPAKLDFNAQLRGEQWLDTARYPEMVFRSTGMKLLRPDVLDVSGELTLHGVTRPVSLQVTFNGGYAGHPMDPNARIGFSAEGSLLRSEFGIGYGIPEPGSKTGVSDRVDIVIEAEFTGPRWKDAPDRATHQ